MSAKDDEVMAEIHRKIDREKALINAAKSMRQSTSNPAVVSRIEGQMRDGMRNIQYFEQTLRDLQMRKLGTDVGSMQLGSNGGPPPPAHQYPHSPDGQYIGDRGLPQPGGPQLEGGRGLMPPRPITGSNPAVQPKGRSNYSKLGEHIRHIDSSAL